jgi:hypothetical protein
VIQVAALAFSPDGGQLLFAARPRTIIWDMEQIKRTPLDRPK